MEQNSTDSAAWSQARDRAEILAGLVDRPGDAEVREVMATLGISRATLFRWLKRFRQDDRTSTLLQRRCSMGAARLAIWGRGRDEREPDAHALLAFLTTRHRKSSPPSLCEQPRLPLAARRANHDFLTRPIARQALLVVVPECDRTAPVLAKPVRHGLLALAQGSLLQNYALTIGVGRLAADPVDHAAAVLLVSDGEREDRLRETLRAWPLPIRRRIYARLRRLRDRNEVRLIPARGFFDPHRRPQSASAGLR